MNTLWQIIVGYLVTINLFALALFAWDKRRARRGQWRISENTLLGVAAFGGTAGAKIGQRWLRHKSSKRSFARELNALIVLQVIGTCVFVWIAFGDGATTLRRLLSGS